MITTIEAPGATRIETLESLIAKLSHQIDATQQVVDELSGVQLLIGASDHSIRAQGWSVTQNRRWLADLRAELQRERNKAALQQVG